MTRRSAPETFVGLQHLAVVTLWATLFLNTTAGLALISDAKAMDSELGGATTTPASTFAVIIAVANAEGRIFWPTREDRIGPRNVFLTMFLLQAALVVALPTLGAGGFVVFTILSFVILMISYSNEGCHQATTPSQTADRTTSRSCRTAPNSLAMDVARKLSERVGVLLARQSLQHI
ncbi:MAG TPA: hypothetical protein VNA27_06240 [Rubrobacteraceae bacterium]|nr:hypothetical protein [Rubrobacteraceae bacterium]